MAKTAKDIKSMNQAPADADHSLNKVRELLFGSIVKTFENNLEQLKSTQQSQFEEFKVILEKHQSQLSSLQSNVEGIESKMNKQAGVESEHKQQLEQNLEQLHAELSNAREDNQQGMHSLKALASKLDDVSFDMNSAIEGNTETLRKEIDSNSRKLDGSKLERMEFARLLKDLAANIHTDESSE